MAVVNAVRFCGKYGKAMYSILIRGKCDNLGFNSYAHVDDMSEISKRLTGGEETVQGDSK